MNKKVIILNFFLILCIMMALPHHLLAQGAGKALIFNGTYQYVSVPNSPSLNVTNAITLEAWMKPTGENWNYQVPITLSPATPQNDYQVKVELTTSNFNYAHTKSDGSDTRFYDGSGTELSYWIENWNTSGTSIIWVKVPTASTTDIFMYYGNSSASSVSNGDNTFEFFDDFEETSLKSGWTFWNPGEDDGYSLTERPGWLRIKVNGDSDSWATTAKAPFVYWTHPNPNTNFVAQTKEDATGIDNKYRHSLLAYIRSFDAGSYNKGYFGSCESATTVKFEADGYRGTQCITGQAIHCTRFRKDASTLYYDWSNDGITWNNCGSYTLPSIPSYWGLGGKSWDKGGSFNADFDYFFVRKYASSEPVATVGNETAPGISKAGAYGIGANTTTAFVSINSQTISGEISSGWNHIAQTYDGSKQKLFINGNLTASSDLTENINSNSNNLMIGNLFNGTIDEVRIWNVARTEEEIRTNMCKKLTGSESGLIGYWRLDEGSGTTANDATSNNNHGMLTNSPSWVWSGAAIGDESAFDYEGTNPADFSVNLAHSDGDNLTVTGDSGTISGIQVYRVDTNSMREGSTKPGESWVMDPLRNWGVFITGTDPSYTFTYNYNGHPGIAVEGDLRLAIRDNLADDSWEDANATLNTENHTLTLTNQTGTEYALGSINSDNSLPVTLTSFTATPGNGIITLKWLTESEIENLGFNIYRSTNENGEFAMLNAELIAGAGSSSEKHEYSYVDQDVKNGITYWYKLEDIDYNGKTEFHGPISATVLGPKEFCLHSNYPNPFNPVTTISYDLAEDVYVELTVYNMIGEKVTTLVKGNQPAGYYNVEWDGRNSQGRIVPSGMYFLKICAGSYNKTNKMVFVK
ncbi:MAG TPA: DUF2341 domain-containing protein [Candidatus Marinimicrobia bacterium]|nr:DUF2341 domain-containing protein [Candidatus Neomarinimicrobiota bacterium]